MKAFLTLSELEALKKFDSPTISNAIETFNVRPRTEGYLGPEIQCRFPKLGVMVGYALTVTFDTRQPGEIRSWDMLFKVFEAVQAAPKPVVAVFKDLSKKRGWAAYWGEIMTTIMKKLGTVGVVTDGAVRDLEQVEKIGFHFFSSTVVVSHGDLKIVDINIPVEITGVTIKPGDLIHGDMNGVVIIPEEVAKEVAAASQKIIDRESQILRVINQEGFDPSQLREFYH